MSYQEFKPSPLLQPYIDAYWASSQATTSSRILPDGYIDIIFNFGQATTTLPAWGMGISGMMTKFREVSLHPDSELIGIRIHPLHFHRWCPVPLHQLKNITVSTKDVLVSWPTALVDQIYQQKNWPNKIALIEQQLLTNMNASNCLRHSLISSVCHRIHQSFVSLSLDHIARAQGIGLRQLERLFRVNVGVTMKEYQTIIRFKHTLQDIASDPKKSLLHVAYDMGYFDHAHLTREINKMAGIPPSQLK